MWRAGRALVAVLGLVLCSARTRATTVVPMSIEDLARSSVAIVIGTVDDLTAVQSPDGRIFTLVHLTLEQVLKGDLSAAAITLKESGGTVAGRREVVFGAPEFRLGETALLFLSTAPDGSLRTTQLGLGKFQLALDTNGMPQAAQRFGPDTTVVLPPATSPPDPAMPLGDLLAAVQRAGPASSATAYRLTPPEATDPSLPHEVTSDFKFFNPPARFFEPDQGIALPFVIDQNGDAILGLTAAREAVDDGFAAWTNVATASITLQDGGLTADVEKACPGPNKVVFDDPFGEIGPPSNCTGTLAVGGFNSNLIETKLFNGMTFGRAQCGRLTFANGWQGCQVWTQCNVAEIATHELGHAIGLAHSSERNPEPDETLRDATMYFIAHFDGRCAGVRTDDINGVGTLYPTALPPTITTPNPLPDGTVFQPYRVVLTATGGTGSFTWNISGQGFPGLNLSPDGVLSGTPQATSNSFFLLIRVADTNGSSHTKLFNFVVHSPGQDGCTGDCNQDGSVTIDEILTGVSIALGSLPANDCPEFDADHSGVVTIDEILSAVTAALSGC
jgi:hypothetical protein